MRRAGQFSSLVILSLLSVSCGEDKPKNHYSLKEVIDLEGTCSEDHATASAKYEGQVVRWQTDETGELSTYGSVTRAGDIVQRVVDEATHPTAYHPPFMISFDHITIDTSAAAWSLHGVSDSKGDIARGFDSTCELKVVKRGTELRNQPQSTSRPTR